MLHLVPSLTDDLDSLPRIAVVIPCYKVKNHILQVIARIGPEVAVIFVIDDACPDGSGEYVKEHCRDPRLRILKHDINKGVGGAVMTGYRAAIADGAVVIVRLDGDGQMNPELIMDFATPILAGEADYVKGNRFFDPEHLWSMPHIRLFGNAVLSLMAKISTGYWQLFDPNNGYTAIHADVARQMPFHKISERYFFETDLLFRLNIHRAKVVDQPMDASYSTEVSNLKIRNIVGEFLWKHIRNFGKRVVYNYYLRDVSLASIQLPLGLFMLLGGASYGGINWYEYGEQNITTPPGTVILAALPVLLGIQFILAFLSHDISSTPLRPIHKTRYKLQTKNQNQYVQAHENMVDLLRM
jgi:dolichol-phosphate mannosyltransferase